eukprot:2908190-Pyramimonas_sp.AAC.1
MEGGGMKPNAVTYGTLVVALGSNGQWEYALQVVELMWQAGIPVTSAVYCELVRACKRANEWERVFEVLDRMKKDKVD